MASIYEDRSARRAIPHLYRLIFAGSGDTLSIRRPGYRLDSGVMSTIGDQQITSPNIPYLCCVIGTCRDDARTIRRPRGAPHGSGMTTVGNEIVSSSGIPHLCRGVCRAGDDACAIWRPVNGIHCAEMPAICEQVCPRQCILDLHDHIFSGRGDVRAIVRRLHVVDRICVSVDEVPVSRGSIPLLYRPVEARGGDAPPVL